MSVSWFAVLLSDRVCGTWEERVPLACTVGELRRLLLGKGGDAVRAQREELGVEVRLVLESNGASLDKDNERLLNVGVQGGSRILCDYV